MALNFKLKAKRDDRERNRQGNGKLSSRRKKNQLLIKS
jgi:hypothetical protein